MAAPDTFTPNTPQLHPNDGQQSSRPVQPTIEIESSDSDETDTEHDSSEVVQTNKHIHVVFKCLAFTIFPHTILSSRQTYFVIFFNVFVLCVLFSCLFVHIFCIFYLRIISTTVHILLTLFFVDSSDFSTPKTVEFCYMVGG